MAVFSPALRRTNVAIIPNFPEEWIDEAKSKWESNFKVNRLIFRKFTGHFLIDDEFVYDWFDFDKELKEDIDKPHLFLLTTKFKSPCHYDKERNSVINIPLRIDNLQSSKFYIAKSGKKSDYDDLIVPSASTYTGGSVWNPNGHYDRFDALVLKRPVAFDSSMPHWFQQNTENSTRCVLSIGFKTTKFEDLLKKMPDSWTML